MFEFFTKNDKSKAFRKFTALRYIELSIRDKCNYLDISFNDVVQCMYIAGDKRLVMYM